MLPLSLFLLLMELLDSGEYLRSFDILIQGIWKLNFYLITFEVIKTLRVSLHTMFEELLSDFC